MEVYIINEKTLEQATTYLPVAIKNGFVRHIASRCIERVGITANDKDISVTIPDMNKENTELKQRYLMGAFVGFYLNASYEVEDKENDDFLMTQEEYDKWAGGHIFNQVERYKSDMKLRDICFDLLQDYKDLEKRLNSEIYSLLQISNEPVNRMIATLQLTISETALENMASKVRELQQELIKMKEEKEKE